MFWSKKKIAVICAVVIICVLAIWILKGGKKNVTTTPAQPPQPPIVKTASGKTVSAVKDPQDAISRLHNRTTKMSFEMTGRGSSSHWVLQGVCNFKYAVIMQAHSTIVEKKQLTDTCYQITELHKIELGEDSMQVSDIDLQLSLSNLDKERFDQYFNASCAIIAALGKPALGALLYSGKEVAEATLNVFDGISVKGLLQQIDTTGLLTNKIDSFLETEIKGAFRAKIRPVTGKTYKVVYYLKNDNPIDVTYTYEDGTPITDDEQLKVLERVNVFMDTHTVPNRKCRISDCWTVHARDIEEVMDPYVDGTYSGNITVRRMMDDADGTWNLQMNRSQLNVIGSDGSTTGDITLTKGYGKVNKQNCTVKEIHVEGHAKLTSVSRHHWLFKSTTDGWCKFVGHLISTPDEK